MVCPLCGRRKARRACPALGRHICTVCCGTKRQIEIQCPSNCVYLTTAREHPPAAALRQHERDVALMTHSVRDFNDRQTQLFLMIGSFLLRYEPSELQSLIDDDVAGAVAALAATFETAARGVIYEHRPASRPAERLVSALKPLFAEIGGKGGAAFERDLAVVLRRVEEAVGESRTLDSTGRRPFLDTLGRILRSPDAPTDTASNREAPRLIVP